jgi:ergothioneine biosynthesis protein EgtB
LSSASLEAATNLVSAKRSHFHPSSARAERLLARFRKLRNFTTSLCADLEPEDYVVQSMPDVSPTKWHLAHTTWFFETFILKKFVPAYQSEIPEYAYLFNSYYNAAGDMHRRDLRGLISRPTVREAQRYRASIDLHIDNLLSDADEKLLDEIEPILVLGIHHEQQHQELLITDIKHVFAQNPLYPVFRDRKKTGEQSSATPGSQSSPLHFVDFEEAIVKIGHDGHGFAYDNEGPRHRALVPAFTLASRPVTNGEYIAFIEDNGYTRPEFWLSLGWMTVNEQRWQAPLYWTQRDGAWWQFTLSGFRAVEESVPVTHVSYFEADAYANWAGARLPTEFEWERAALDCPVEGNFVEGENFHPRALPASGHNRDLHQMFGDVWEWTRSAYSPYPGYRAAPGALGEYNGKFMCNQYVLRGGSCATSRSHIRRTYRNFFQPEKRWQFTGIRLARDPQ